MLANPRKVLGAHMKMGMAMKSFHGGAAEKEALQGCAASPIPEPGFALTGVLAVFSKTITP